MLITQKPLNHLLITTLILFTHYLTLNSSLNITHILSHYPSLSNFTSLLTASAIVTDINPRPSFTLLAVPNTFLLSPPTSPSSLPDVIRFHVILQYLTWSDLRQLPPSGTLFPTLLSGRAGSNPGSVNLTFNSSNGVVSIHPLNDNNNNSSDSVNILSLIKTVPFNISIYTVDSLLNPYDSDLTASNSQLPSQGINITKALIDGHNFNVAVDMLTASGVISSFKKAESGAGITLFVPTDVAFSNLPSDFNFQVLPAQQKSLILKFHVLLSYYPLGSLESIVNPVQPTLATEDKGAGSYTLNIKRINGSVSINTGLIKGVVSQTVLDENPVAIFGVSSVLLPKEIFNKGDLELESGPAPILGPGPENSTGEPFQLSPPSGIVSKGWRSSIGCGCDCGVLLWVGVGLLSILV